MLIKRPIYNQQLKCVALEILSNQHSNENEEINTRLAELISNSDTELPLFIPFSLKSCVEDHITPLVNPIILKLCAEDIESKYSLEELQESNFSIALLINKPQQLAWLNFAEYIGLTEQLMDESDVSKVVTFTKNKSRKVIAYGINKPLVFNKCKALDMDYYCGDFLFVPIENDDSEVAGNKLNLLQLIQSLQSCDCDFNHISQIINNDPLLSYQLLKIANTLAFSSYQEIDSIDQAITRLGLNNLKNWVMLLSMKNISNKPIEIIESGLIRAHMAKELAQKTSEIAMQSAYMAGLLSIIDTLLNKPMHELINHITLAEEIKEALTQKTGPIGEILSIVVAYEEGHWEQMTQPEFMGLNLSKLYIDCLGLVTKGTKPIHF